MTYSEVSYVALPLIFSKILVDPLVLRMWILGFRARPSWYVEVYMNLSDVEVPKIIIVDAFVFIDKFGYEELESGNCWNHGFAVSA